MAEKFQREYLIFEELYRSDDYYVVEISSIRDGEKTKDATIRDSHNNSLDRVIEAVRKEGFGNQKEDIIVTTIPASRIGKVTVHGLSEMNIVYCYKKLREAD